MVMSSDMIAVSVFSSTNLFIMTPTDNYLLQNAPLPPRNRFIIIIFFSQLRHAKLHFKTKAVEGLVTLSSASFSIIRLAIKLPRLSFGSTITKKIVDQFDS